MPRTLPILLLLAGVALAPAAAAQAPSPYHNYATMRTDLQALVDAHPEIASLSVLGRSVRGLELWRVDVADFSDPEWESSPALLVDGGHHGNEILGIEAAYYFLEALLLDAAADPSILDGKRVVVVPAVNPDGWVQDSRVNARLVNLNRNYPWMWNERGTNPLPGQGNYAGPSAASEPETRTLMDLMAGLDLRGYVTYHTGSYDLVLPWDPDEDAPIPDWPLYERFLAEAENASGLTHRPPGGLGESHAHAYGNLGAFGILPEVSVEQFLPASQTDVRERVSAGVAVARVAFDHLEDLGGRVVVERAAGGTVTVRNAGWSTAWRVSADGATFVDLAPGATAELPAGACRSVEYDRVLAAAEADFADAAAARVRSAVPLAATGGACGEILPAPAPVLVAALATAIAAIALRARRDGDSAPPTRNG